MKAAIFKLLNTLGRRFSGRGLGLERVERLKAFYEYVYQRVAPSSVVLVESQGSRMYVNARDEPLGRSLVTQGIYEAYETQLFKSSVRPGMTVVDIGANVGYYTLLAAGLVGETGEVYAFEPEPGNYELLVRNVELNGYKNVVTQQKAVSDSAGAVKLYIDSANFGNRSFGQSNIVHSGGSVDVQTVSLDDFILTRRAGRKIDIIKMDAQGAEGLIVEGAQRVLQQHRPKVFMEFEPDMLTNLGTDPLALLDRLRSWGYGINLIDYESQTVIPVTGGELLELCKKTGYLDLFLEM